MNLTKYKTLATVVEQGSLTQAARQMMFRCWNLKSSVLWKTEIDCIDEPDTSHCRQAVGSVCMNGRIVYYENFAGTDCRKNG